MLQLYWLVDLSRQGMSVELEAKEPELDIMLAVQEPEKK